MNFATDKLDSIFLRMIFGFIKTMKWQAFDLRVRFKGRVIDKELGGGFEARDFKVNLNKQEDLNYISPREQKELNYKTKLDRDHQNRMRGGEKNSRNWEIKRRQKQRELEAKK